MPRADRVALTGDRVTPTTPATPAAPATSAEEAPPTSQPAPDRLGTEAVARKARPVELGIDLTASGAFAVVAAECTDHWRTNEALLVESRAMPHLHQTRVGIRRLRSAFSLFRPVLHEVPGARGAAHRLRSLALPFGAARDLDVLLAGPLVDVLDARALQELWQAREAAYDDVLAILASTEWADAGATLDALLAAVPWGLADDPPVRDLAGHALGRRWGRVVAATPHLTSLPPTARHRVRIEAKKLRYGCEFFASVYAADEPRVVTEAGEVLAGALAYAWHVERVQTALGLLNDHTTADALLHAVGGAAPAVDEDALLRAGVEECERLASVEPFWR